MHQYEDVDAVVLHESGMLAMHDSAIVGAMDEAPSFAPQGPAYTLRSPRGAIVMCGGMVPFWRGVGETWALASIHVERYARDVYSFARAITDEWMIDHNLHRLQAHVRAGNKRGCSFLQHLRFEPQGVDRRYGPDGEDYDVWARFL